MWDPLGPRIEPVSPALQGGFLTTGHLGKSQMLVLAGKTAILWKDVDESQVHVNIGLWLSGLVFHLYEFEKKSKENLIQGNNLLHCIS